MSPGKEMDEVALLRHKLAEAETELSRRRDAEQTSEARFRMLADAAPAMIWMSTPDAVYTYYNPSWLEFRGTTLEQETGEGWSERIHPDDRELFLETYLKAFSARQPFRAQYRIRRAGGDFRWIEDSGVPRHDETGAFLGYIGSAADINDRKRGVYV